MLFKILQSNPHYYKHEYCWLYGDRLKKLADFLNYLNECDDVKEIIILGDLLDHWVCPTKFSPPKFEDIINQEKTPNKRC